MAADTCHPALIAEMYEIFEHTADLGLRVRAATVEQLFADAARGLFSVIVANLDQVRMVQEKTLAVAGQEYDYLMFDWLAELLYTFETEKLILAQFDVQLHSEGISATCRGEPIDPDRHQLEHEIKAITYHQLRVEQAGPDWLAEVIVDI